MQERTVARSNGGATAVLLSLCLLLGCGEGPGRANEKTARQEVQPQLPLTAKQEGVEGIQASGEAETQEKTEAYMLAALEACKDLFDLYEMKEAYKQGSAQTETVLQALEGKWNRLVAECDPQEVIPDHVDLLAFAMRPSGDGECRAWFLFRTKKAMDKDYTIQMMGYVDKSHQPRLPQRFRDWGYSYQPWNVEPDPPTSTWKAGELIVISEVLEEVQPIPYDVIFTSHFQEKDALGKPKRNESGEIAPRINVDSRVGLGWYACLE